ncbi:hypothetical protein EH221_00005 [bacterium]|nr:MAG: hypothetical protein EH221_00005 [bacterium]
MLITLVIAIAIAVITLLVSAFASLKWRYLHDSTLMIYAGWLISQGAIPYLDFFDMNMPGIYYLMMVVGLFFGWTDIVYRALDLSCLVLISVLTFMWMRQFGKLPAISAAIMFHLWYLHGGPYVSLQREYVALVPFTGMLVLIFRMDESTKLKQLFFAGLLGGITVLIKPLFLLFGIATLIILFRSKNNPSIAKYRTGFYTTGFVLPLGIMFVYLVSTGGLTPFIEIAINYWPLYTNLTGLNHEPISGFPRLIYILKSSREALLTFYTSTAIIGLMVLNCDKTHKTYAWILGLLLIIGAIYPALSAQFWGYHLIPFTYLTFCSSSLTIRVIDPTKWKQGFMAPFVMFILLLVSLASLTAEQVLSGWKDNGGENPPKYGVPDEIHQFLKSELNPGDLVQPLDWTGGAIHAMLMAKAPLATRFIYDFHFYHHINNPYIKKLRNEFIVELAASEPRFIIQILHNKPWPTGPNTTRDFPELTTYLSQHYTAVRQRPLYNILERINGDQYQHKLMSGDN